MPLSVPIDRLMTEVLGLGREAGSVSDLLSKSGQRIKSAFMADEVTSKDLTARGASRTQTDEALLSGGKPYLDNRLSDYSAFPELISSYKAGFRSCAVLPVVAEGKGLGMITLLSRSEDAFDQNASGALAVISGIIGSAAYVKLERERSLSMARYFDAAFNSILPQALMDTSGGLMKANKGFLNLVDKPAKDMPGRNMKEFFLIDGGELAKLCLGKPIEVRSGLYPDRTFLMTSSRISERLMHVLIQDEAEEIRLREKELLFEYGEEIYALLDGGMRFVWSSANTDRILKTAIEGLRLTDLVVDSGELIRKLEESDGKALSVPARLNLGNDLFAEVRLTLLKNDLGFSCIIMNDYGKRIGAAQKFADDFAQLSTDLVIKIDSLGYISGINKAAERLLGYRSQELEKVPISTLCADAESLARITEAFALLKKNSSVTGMFLNIAGRSRTDVIPVNMNLLGLADESGRQAGYLSIGQELLTKREYEESMDRLADAERHEEKLKAESDLKTQFIYNISHDLKTPLTSIKGYSKLMMEGQFGAITDEQKGALDTVLGEVDRLMALILQILDVAKLASGKIKLDIQQVDFKDVGENPSVRALAERARGQGLYFSINIDYNVPAVPADPNRIIQVFVNLIDNALKFTEKGGIKISVTRKGRYARVEVADTGVGIREEDRAKLFRKFYQVSRKDLTMQPKAGTGLGLSIVKEIVNLHGGKVGVKSEMGKGSTFWFTIPLEKKKRKQAQPAEPQQEKPEG